jgi:hypothetical protein
MVCLRNINVDTLHTGDTEDNNNNNNSSNNNNNSNVHNIFNMLNNIECSTNCKYRTAVTLYTLEHGLFQVYNCNYPASM